jgi:NAD dependent epimerase/dehydratase family enzyme
MSWISLADEVAVIRHAVDSSTLSGPLNAVSPDPVTNAELTKALARAVRRPAFFNVPSSVLKLAFGSEFAEELLLASQRVLPAQLAASGYQFTDGNLEEALKTILARSA